MPLDDVDAGTQLEAPDTDVEVTQGEGSNSTGTVIPEEPFLSVNERSVYKTKEDAVKAFNEAGSRIAELSRWAKQNEKYGIKDPQEQAALYDELIALRKEKADAAVQAGKSAEKADEQELSAEDKAVLKLMKKLSPAMQKELGYTPKADFEKQQEELKALKEWRDSQDAARTQDSERQEQSRLEASEVKASQWLKDAGIDDPTGEKLAEIIAPAIIRYINADPERVEKWHRGGLQMESVLKEGYDRAIKYTGWIGNSATRPAGSASVAANRGKQLAAKTTLPPQGDANKRPAPVKSNASDKDLNERAWAEFTAVRDGKRA